MGRRNMNPRQACQRFSRTERSGEAPAALGTPGPHCGLVAAPYLPPRATPCRLPTLQQGVVSVHPYMDTYLCECERVCLSAHITLSLAFPHTHRVRLIPAPARERLLAVPLSTPTLVGSAQSDPEGSDPIPRVAEHPAASNHTIKTQGP